MPDFSFKGIKMATVIYGSEALLKEGAFWHKSSKNASDVITNPLKVTETTFSDTK